MRPSALFGLALLGCLVAACTPDLGACDEGAARKIVYDTGGLPYYAGQAQMVASCNLCHRTGMGASETSSDSRNGAPHDLNWDLGLAKSDTASTDQLRAGQQLTYNFRGDIWGQVSGGSMPPLLPTMDPAMGVTSYHYAGGTTQLESLRTPEGREILRNWLACKTPVIERTPENPRPPGEEPIGAIEPHEQCMTDDDCHTLTGNDAFFCDVDLHQCELHPTWPAIYAGFIQPSCAVAGCHAEAGSAGPPPVPAHISGLILSPTDSRMAYAALVASPPQGSSSPACGAPRVRVVPGDPAMSLLLSKLVGHTYGDPTDTVCGPIMPYGSMTPYAETDKVFVLPIHDWIMAGAPEM